MYKYSIILFCILSVFICVYMTHLFTAPIGSNQIQTVIYSGGYRLLPPGLNRGFSIYSGSPNTYGNLYVFKNSMEKQAYITGYILSLPTPISTQYTYAQLDIVVGDDSIQNSNEYRVPLNIGSSSGILSLTRIFMFPISVPVGKSVKARIGDNLGNKEYFLSISHVYHEDLVGM